MVHCYADIGAWHFSGNTAKLASPIRRTGVSHITPPGALAYAQFAAGEAVAVRERRRSADFPPGAMAHDPDRQIEFTANVFATADALSWPIGSGGGPRR
ncbi:MAG: hypothetical protein KDB55_07950 [Mycobacterium sp.]|nr:hypothetical protein [Mycobacterium sp.]